jgi:hypothetical protein
MAPLDSLPADQRAVIQLVLQQGRRYDDIAAMLSVDRAGVRQRALDAFDALGPDNSLPAPQRALLTDYLLGQLPGRVADQVHDRIADSPAQRAWLRVVASEVGGLASGELPAIPAPGARRADAASAAKPGPDDSSDAPSRTRRTRRIEPALPIQAAPAAAPPAAPETRSQRRSGAGSGAPGGLGGSSRRGGAILLGVSAALTIAAIVVILVFALGGSSPKHHVASSGTTTPASSSTTGTSTTSTTSTTGEKFLGQVNLNSPSGVKGRAGVAQVVKQKSTLGVLLVAQGMPANTKRNAYAVWLYNSTSDSHLVGFVNARVGSNGRLETEGVLPANVAHYKHMLVTLETAQTPKSPGPIVLEGSVTISS